MENPVLWSKNPGAVRLGGQFLFCPVGGSIPLFPLAKRAPSGEIIITTRTTIMLDETGGHVHSYKPNPCEMGSELPRMAIRTSTVIFIGQALFPDKTLILTALET